MDTPVLLYGANGFTGTLIAHLAVQRGLRPILAGRNAAQLAALAAALKLPYQVCGLEDASALDRALHAVDVVLHCAGPFLHTWRPMVEACLRTGTHYLDLTGELPVYAALAARDAHAKAAGVMLLPGVGFDVVPTDCLAAHLKRRLPSATHLTLAFWQAGPARPSRGTATTAVESVLPVGTTVRRQGQLATLPHASQARLIDFGPGRRKATLFPWGDVFMAFYSTGIPNIADYAVLDPTLGPLLTAARYLRPVFGWSIVRNGLKRAIRSRPAGPTAAERAATRTHVWGEVRDAQGNAAVARLHGPEAGYTWAPRTALAVVQQVLAGVAPPGFQTPALAYGPDFVLGDADVTREDLA